MQYKFNNSELLLIYIKLSQSRTLYRRENWFDFWKHENDRKNHTFLPFRKNSKAFFNYFCKVEQKYTLRK